MADLLEFLIRVAGGGEAAAQVKGVRDSFVELGASAKAAGGEMAAAEGAGGKFGAVLGSIGKGSLVVGAALAAVGAEAVKMSNSFNTEMLKIQTEGGASRKELERMKGAVLDLATSGQSMGQGPVALAQGLYHLESMGLRGAKALHALKLASQEAAISGASLEDTTTSLGGAMFVGIKGVSNITKLMGSLNAIAGAGNMRFQDLNEALGTGLLGSAKLAHLSLQETGAALAVLTDSGYHASSAAAQLGTALHYLYAPTGKGDTALKSIGLTGNRLAADLRKPQGLLAALRDLRTHIHAAGANPQDILNNLLPGGRGRVLLNLYQMQNRLAPKYGQIVGTSNDFGQHVSEQRNNPATQLKTAVAELQGEMVKLGDVLAPIVVPALAKFVGFVAQAVGWLTKGAPAFGQVTSLAGGLGSAISSLWHTAVPAFEAIWKAAEKAFGGRFLTSLMTIIRVIGTALVRTVQGAIPGIVDIFKGGFNIIAGIVNFVADLLTGRFGKAFGDLKQIFTGAISVLKGIMITLINDTFILPLNQMISLIDKIHIRIPGWVPVIGGSHIGFNIGQVGLIGVNSSHAPATTGSAGGSATKTTGGVQIHPHGQVIHEHIHVMVDGRELGRAMRRRTQIAMMGSHA